MSNITRLHHALPLSPAINKAVADLDSAIAKAVDAAMAAGLPQGLIVTLLHGHAHSETARMLEKNSCSFFQRHRRYCLVFISR